MGARCALASMSICVIALAGVVLAGCAPADSAGPGAADPLPASGEEEALVLDVTSSAFRADERISARSCRAGFPGGENVSPPLKWSGVPDSARSLVVTMIDLHPRAAEWLHWAIVDLSPESTSLAEGASGSLASPARELVNTFGERGYGGPQPPAGSGDHTYAIAVYALDTASLDIAEAPSAADIRRAVSGHVLAWGTLNGMAGR